MPASTDVKFIFDTSSFKKGFDNIRTGFNKITTSIKNKTSQVSSGVSSFFKKNEESTKALTDQTKNVSTGVFNALTKFALLGGAILGAFALAKGALTSFVPEIGATLGIAKDIFFRNLLFPLRKFLLPILNKILDWTRRNRAAFVKWGAVLVNIFKVVIAGAKLVFGIVKGLFTAVVDSITAVFGKTTNTITETINVVIFKLATLFAFLQLLLEPAFKVITKIFTAIIQSVKDFGEGFIKGFSSVFESVKLFDLLGESLEKVKTLIDELGISMEGAGVFFKKFGEILGTVVGESVKLTIELVNGLIESITNLVKLLKGDIGVKDFGGKILGSITKFNKSIALDIIGGQSPKKVNDALITKDGQVIEFNPNDNIIATQSPAGGGVGDVTITFGNTIVQVTEGNAEVAGQNFLRGAGEVLREALIENLFIKGSRL